MLEGDPVLEAGGEQWTLTPGSFARVGADQKRKITPGASGVTIVALGGKPGVVEPRG